MNPRQPTALAERNIVNLSACERFLLQQCLPLRYETSVDQLRYLLAILRELLHAHPIVHADSARHPLWV